MRKAFLILLLAFTAVSCSKQANPPSHLINEDTYIDLLIELHLLRNYQAHSTVDSSTVDSLMKQIFKKYGVTRQQFKKSHDYYQRQLEKQSNRINQAIDRLRKDHIQKGVATDTTTTKRKAVPTQNIDDKSNRAAVELNRETPLLHTPEIFINFQKLAEHHGCSPPKRCGVDRPERHSKVEPRL